MHELIQLLRELFDKHASKVIGYVATAAAFVAIADKQLVLDTLGPNATAWALLITGILGAARGHQATAREKREKLDELTRAAVPPDFQKEE